MNSFDKTEWKQAVITHIYSPQRALNDGFMGGGDKVMWVYRKPYLDFKYIYIYIYKAVNFM